jgi:hypothetical protein
MFAPSMLMAWFPTPWFKAARVGAQRRSSHAAEKLIRTQSRTPCVMVTDKRGSDGAARTGMGPNDRIDPPRPDHKLPCRGPASEPFHGAWRDRGGVGEDRILCVKVHQPVEHGLGEGTQKIAIIIVQDSGQKLGQNTLGHRSVSSFGVACRNTTLTRILR